MTWPCVSLCQEEEGRAHELLTATKLLKPTTSCGREAGAFEEKTMMGFVEWETTFDGKNPGVLSFPLQPTQ